MESVTGFAVIGGAISEKLSVVASTEPAPVLSGSLTSKEALSSIGSAGSVPSLYPSLATMLETLDKP